MVADQSRPSSVAPCISHVSNYLVTQVLEALGLSLCKLHYNVTVDLCNPSY